MNDVPSLRSFLFAAAASRVGRRPRWALGLVLFGLLFGPMAATSRAFAGPGFARREMAVPGSILALTRGDLDGDGRTDLVVSYRRGAGPRAERFLALFFRGEDGWPARPDLAFTAPKNAGVFDVGDANGDGRDELLYLAADGVHAQGFEGRRPSPLTRIVTGPSLVVSPEEDDLGSWDFSRSVTPGQDFLILPARNDLRIYRREEGVWKIWSRVDVDLYSTYDAEGQTFRRDRRGGSTARPYSFRATTIVPVVDFVEQTGDGRLDLVTSFEDRVAVFAAGEDGVLATQPTRRTWFAVRTPNELETRDAGVSTLIQDLDGDGIADACVQKIAGGVTSLTTETFFYRGLRGGGFEDKPAQAFKDSGFAALAQFIDVDGDGRLEMVHPESEVSIVRMSQVMLSKELSLGIRVRRAADKPLFFDRAPVQKLETTFGVDLTVGATLLGTYPLFGHDFDGDGIKDVLLSEGGEKMVLHRGTKKGAEPFEEDGHVTLNAPGASTTLLIPTARAADASRDVLVYYVDRAELAGKMFVFSSPRASR